MKILISPLLMFVMAIGVSLAAESHGQPPKFKKPFQKPTFKKPSGKQPSFGNPSASENEVAEGEFSATAGFKVSSDSKSGVLEVRCRIPEGMHIYSMTQPKATPGPKKTEIKFDDSDDYTVDQGSFVADKDPHVKEVELQEVDSEEFEGEVVFSATIGFTDGVKAADVEIPFQILGQICTDDGSCSEVQEKLVAKYEGLLDEKVEVGEKYTVDGQHLLLQGKVIKVVDGKPAKTAVEPGDKIRIEITAEPTDGYHVYSFKNDLEKTGGTTFLALQKTGGWSFSGPEADDVPIVHEADEYYETPVTWTYEAEVPKSFEQQSNWVGGIMGLQTCDGVCDRPSSVAWKVEIPLGKSLKGVAIQFDDAGNYAAAKDAVMAEKEIRGNVLDSSSTGAGDDAGEWSEKSLGTVLPLAFLAGFILNFMPCVLPVIGLKVMSFVYQAGQNPRQIFLLNAMFCLGMVSVFMVLAFFAVRFGMGWGEQFEGLTFKIVMIAVVVVFGLSFFGVWEIPIPGFGGSSDLGQKEGLTGAFLKGILTTVLATPCSGPMLIPAIVWAIAQPPTVTYLVFLALGLGMGAPYLVIGVYPKLVSSLPQPGPWMETFKKIMGFIMLGTAVFLMGAIEQKYVVSVLSLLVLLGFACWWMGRTSLAAPLPERMKAWGISAAIGAFAIWFSFFFILSQYELDYQKYSRLSLDQHLKEGRTVFVDFTANW